MIYLDNNATTRVDDEVLEAMLPYLQDEYGNASSVQHRMGRKANEAVERARSTISSKLNVEEKEIIFTSSSTESINMVLKGVFQRYKSIGNHIITVGTEHKAVLATCDYLSRQGARISYLAVDKNGQINLDELTHAIQSETILVCIMAANNETGVIHPITEIATICTEKNVLFFCDTTQYIGKENLDLSQVKIDIACFSGHKMHGPKGIGGLFIRRKNRPIQIEPLIIGGQQENGLRASTYPVPNIVGLGKSFECLNVDNDHIATLKNIFEVEIVKNISDCYIHASTAPRLSNTSNICFKYTRASEIMTRITEIAISSGSACVSGSRDPSHVLKAMHLTDEDAYCSLRFSFSKYNTLAEVEQTVQQLRIAVSAIRAQSPVWQLYKDRRIE